MDVTISAFPSRILYKSRIVNRSEVPEPWSAARNRRERYGKKKTSVYIKSSSMEKGMALLFFDLKVENGERA